MTRALRGIGVEKAAIKWPNDLQIGGAKLGGILAEGCDLGSRHIAVVGIGVNLTGVPKSVNDRELASVAAAIYSDSDFYELRSRLLSGYLRSLDELELLRDRAPEALLREYRSMLSTIGQEVMVEMGDGSLMGLAAGVDGQGRLVLQTAEGERAIASGDVVHLRPATAERKV